MAMNRMRARHHNAAASRHTGFAGLTVKISSLRRFALVFIIGISRMFFYWFTTGLTLGPVRGSVSVRGKKYHPVTDANDGIWLIFANVSLMLFSL